MTGTEALEKTLLAFRRYYNIRREGVAEPFAAEAEFRTHDEHFFLMKSAKLFESESREYVFFAEEECLDKERLLELDKKAWEEGISRAEPGEGHKSTDVALIILAGCIKGDAAEAIRKQRHYKSYRLGLHGWSKYRLAAVELSSGQVIHNKEGKSLRKTLSNLLQQS